MPTAPAKTAQRPAVEHLPNGVPVVLQPMEHVNSTAIGLWVRAGGRYEPAALSGASHFLEHLLFKGTRSRSCEALKQAVEGVGPNYKAVRE